MPGRPRAHPRLFPRPWPVVGPGVAAESTAPPTGSSPARDGALPPVLVTLGDLTRIPIDFDDRYAHRQPIHRAHARLLEQVAVEISCDLDARVPELTGDVFEALVLSDQE